MKKRYIMVIAALCGSIAAGIGLTTNIAGLFFTPVAADFGIGRGNVSMTLTICNLTYAFGGIATGKLLTKKHFRPLMILGSALTVGATLLLAISGNVWLMYVLNALRGFSTGLLGTVMASIVINNWFHTNTGMMTSIAMGCSGLASAVFSPLFSMIIARMGWRFGYTLSAILMAALYLPIILLPIGLTPESVGELPFGDRVGAPKARERAGGKVPPVLILMIALYATTVGFLTSVVQHFPGISESYGLAVGATMLSAGMIANTSGKLLIGVLIDRIGTMKGILAMAIFVVIGILLMLFVHAGAALVIGAFLIGLGYSLQTVGVAMITRQTFGLEHYGNIYPKISMCVTVSYALGTTMIGFIFDQLKSYTPVFWIMLIGLGTGLTCALMAQRKKDTDI